MKYQNLFRNILALALLWIVSTVWAADGVVITSTNYDIDGSGNKVKSGTSVMYIGKEMLLVEQKENSGKTTKMMFNPKTNELTAFLNNREYMVITESDLKMIKEQLTAMFDMMKKMQENMSDEQKKMMQQNMPDLSDNATSYSFKKAGTGNVNGWNTVTYEAMANGEKTGDMMIAPYSTLGISKADVGSLEKFVKFFFAQLSDLGKQFNMGGSETIMMGGLDSPAFNDGIPVKVLSYEKGKLSGEMIIESIDKKDIPSSTFTIPQGMVKKELSDMFQGGFR